MGDGFAGSPLALALAGIAVLVVGFLGRSAVHSAIRVLAGAIHEALVLAAGLVMSAQERLVRRNREVLLEMGRQTSERLIEREFHRVHTVVARDLSGYPALNRKLADQVARIDEDYRRSSDVPPTPPEWTRAIEAIANVPSNGDPVVGRILRDVHRILERAQADALREYRAASSERHRLLHRMLPCWRRLDQTLSKVDGTIRGLHERSRVIDEEMEKYDQILSGTDSAVRMLSASSLTYFVTSALVLGIALLGGFINFHLIALPMSEMVGASSYVGPVRTSDVAALVVILMEASMGLFLMESLRITRMFPVIGTMDDLMRRRMVWVSFFLLLMLAGVESSLAYMRDLLAADREALTQSLAGVAVVQAQLRWIPSLGQMLMGFMLPFALAFAAIPLESFIQSSRVVLGAWVALCMRGVAALLEFMGSLLQNLGPVLVHIYDFLIIVPLRIEQLLTRHREAAFAASEPHRSETGG
ncbi:MAG: hypothetical protein ACE5IL_14620 [Myxococcota bacterium]